MTDGAQGDAGQGEYHASAGHQGGQCHPRVAGVGQRNTGAAQVKGEDHAAYGEAENARMKEPMPVLSEQPASDVSYARYGPQASWVVSAFSGRVAAR